jgi:tricarballylate dehydrogenase
MSMRKFDVVVVGSGIAGLSAALSARQAGASVALAERATPAESGGNTRYTEAFLRMKSVDEPADDLADAILGDFMGYPDPGVAMETLRSREMWTAPAATLNVVDEQVVATLGERAGPTLRWLEGHGVKIAPLPTPFLTTSTTRISPVGGGLALVEALTAQARKLGIEIFYRTTARSLVADAGVVTGLRAVSPDGPVTLSGAVVLACGGYEGNPEMMARYHGDRGMLTRPVARGGHYNKGEGIEMALAVGAATAGNFAMFHAEPVDPRSGQPEAAIFAMPYGILVNAEGHRFADEAPGPVDAWYERITRKIHAQTHGVAYLILDADARTVPNLSAALRTDQPPITGGSIDELAAKIAVPAATLRATVEAFNAACGGGEWDPARPDGLATSGLTPPKSNWARPVASPPYHAYPVIASNVFTFGGLRANDRAEVLDRDGGVIRGLYAAGEITGLYYSNYTGSSSVLRGAVFGKIAGERAAELARAELARAELARAELARAAAR